HFRSPRFSAVTEATSALAGATLSLVSPCRATSDSTVRLICSCSDEISAIRRMSSVFGSLLEAALTPSALHAGGQPVTPFDAATQWLRLSFQIAAAIPKDSGTTFQRVAIGAVAV